MEPDGPEARELYIAEERASDRQGYKRAVGVAELEAWAAGMGLNRERRLGGLGRTRDKLQHMVQLVFQQHLVVCRSLYQGGDALVGGEYVLGACAW